MSNPFPRPYIVSWNLTYRCNLACEHCYLDAGARSKRKVFTEEFSNRGELTTEQCFRVIDQLVEVAPESVTILTGGEPLLRRDIIEIIRYARERKLWVVVGTNGVLITETLAQMLKEEGVRGMALSLDALASEAHDKFRVVKGAWDNTVQGAKTLTAQEMPFIIQTTVGKHNHEVLEQIADFAYNELGAKVWNLYFLVQTGRGQFVSDLTQAEYADVLNKLHGIQKKYYQKMVVNAKCAPHYITTLFEREPASPFLKTYNEGAGGCPAGTHYLGIRPNGDVTPCPYLPAFGGNLKEQPLLDIWKSSELFVKIRERAGLGGKCGGCEFNSHCGGCRARAFGTTGNYLAEDPLCSFEPGQYAQELVRLRTGSAITYGQAEDRALEWDEAAKERIQKIPAFVRGMVVKSVESYCRERGVARISLEQLEQIRAKMPTPKVFGGR